MTIANLRQWIGETLRTDSDLDAFCLDHFPMVFRRFTHGMDRQQKVTLLLTLAAAIDIQSTLEKICTAERLELTKCGSRLTGIIGIVAILIALSVCIHFANFQSGKAISSHRYIVNANEYQQQMVVDLGQAEYFLRKNDDVLSKLKPPHPKRKQLQLEKGHKNDNEQPFEPNPHIHM